MQEFKRGTGHTHPKTHNARVVTSEFQVQKTHTPIVQYYIAIIIYVCVCVCILKV